MNAVNFLNSTLFMGARPVGNVLSQCQLPDLFNLRFTSRLHCGQVNRFLKIFNFSTQPDETDKTADPCSPSICSFTNWIEAASSDERKWSRLRSAYQVASCIQRVSLSTCPPQIQASLFLVQEQALKFKEHCKEHYDNQLVVQLFKETLEDKFLPYLASDLIKSSSPTRESLFGDHFICIYYQHCMHTYGNLPRQDKSFFLQRMLEAQKRSLQFHFTAEQEASNCLAKLEEKVEMQEQKEETRVLASVEIALPYKPSSEVYLLRPQLESLLGRVNPYDTLFKQSIKEGKMDCRHFLNEVFFFHLTTPSCKRSRAFCNFSFEMLFNYFSFLIHFLSLPEEDLEEFFTLCDIYLIELFFSIRERDSFWGSLKNRFTLLQDDPSYPSRSLLLGRIIHKIINYAPLETLSHIVIHQPQAVKNRLLIFFNTLNQSEAHHLFNILFDVDMISLKKSDLTDENLYFLLRIFLEVTHQLLSTEGVDAVWQKTNSTGDTIFHLLLQHNSPDSYLIMGLLLQQGSSHLPARQGFIDSLTGEQKSAIEAALPKQKHSCSLS